MQCLLPGFQHPGLSGKRICTFTPASTVCNVIPRTVDICQYQKYTKEAPGMLPFLYGLQREGQDPPLLIALVGEGGAPRSESFNVMPAGGRHTTIP